MVTSGERVYRISQQVKNFRPGQR